MDAVVYGKIAKVENAVEAIQQIVSNLQLSNTNLENDIAAVGAQVTNLQSDVDTQTQRLVNDIAVVLTHVDANQTAIEDNKTLIQNLQQQVSALQALVNGEGTKLVELTAAITIPANLSVTQDLFVGFTNFMINTVYGNNVTNTNSFDIAINDKATNDFPVYRSIKASQMYDIANVPMTDKDNTQSMHLKVTNYGVSDITVNITIKCTSLK